MFKVSQQRVTVFVLLGILATAAIASAISRANAQQPAGEMNPGGEVRAPGEAATAPAAPKSTFWWIIRSSGPIGALILCLSIYFVATVIRLFIELRPEVAMPPDEVAHCEQLLQARDYQGLYDFSSKCQSFYCRLVSIGIAELPSGLAEAREIMDRNADAETVDMERKISMLAVLGTLGPMIGLVGTLQGMIESFSVIALHDVQLKASEVADGISKALVLTFEGVSLSVPAIYFFAVFKNRVAKISVDTLLAADELVRRMAQQVKTPGAAPSAAPPVPARV
jgi:biopolymer transport protein ExbB